VSDPNIPAELSELPFAAQHGRVAEEKPPEAFPDGTPGDGMGVGAFAYDARRGRVGEVMHISRNLYALRPAGGGLEWDARREDLRPATALDRLRPALKEVNARSEGGGCGTGLVKRRWCHLEWTLKQVESWGVRAHVQCVSGSPRCGAAPPLGPETRTPDGALAWAEEHLRATGHRRYQRSLHDTVQWDPPLGVDPRTLPGVTT
jgi:hypothetical protein